MGVRFEWYDETKTVLRYIVEGDWNWSNFHTGVRASLFTLHNHPQVVDTLIDLRGSTRPRLPAGLAAHVRTFGKKLTPALSGRAIVIGLPPEDESGLQLDTDRILLNQEGSKIYFVDDEAGIRAVLAQPHS